MRLLAPADSEAGIRCRAFLRRPLRRKIDCCCSGVTPFGASLPEVHAEWRPRVSAYGLFLHRTRTRRRESSGRTERRTSFDPALLPAFFLFAATLPLPLSGSRSGPAGGNRGALVGALVVVVSLIFAVNLFVIGRPIDGTTRTGSAIIFGLFRTLFGRFTLLTDERAGTGTRLRRRLARRRVRELRRLDDKRGTPSVPGIIVVRFRFGGALGQVRGVDIIVEHVVIVIDDADRA